MKSKLDARVEEDPYEHRAQFGRAAFRQLAGRKKLSAEVADYLRDAIISGHFSPGERLSPSALASDLRVSPMPVREALAALAADGLIDAITRRGFRVAHISRRDIRDAFTVHAFIAGLLAEAASRVVVADTIKELRLIHSEIDRLSSLPDHDSQMRIENLNFDFHRTINRVPDAYRLRRFLANVSQFAPRHFYDSIPHWVDATVKDHPKIIDALESRDPDGARRLMEQHILRAGALLDRNLDQHGFWQ